MASHTTAYEVIYSLIKLSLYSMVTRSKNGSLKTIPKYVLSTMVGEILEPQSIKGSWKGFTNWKEAWFFWCISMYHLLDFEPLLCLRPLHHGTFLHLSLAWGSLELRRMVSSFVWVIPLLVDNISLFFYFRACETFKRLFWPLVKILPPGLLNTLILRNVDYSILSLSMFFLGTFLHISLALESLLSHDRDMF